jgi:hypothetical protein
MTIRVMPALPPRAMPDNLARLYVLEATIEIVKTENEILKRRLAAAETWAAQTVITKRLDMLAADRVDAPAAERARRVQFLRPSACPVRPRADAAARRRPRCQKGTCEATGEHILIEGVMRKIVAVAFVCTMAMGACSGQAAEITCSNSNTLNNLQSIVDDSITNPVNAEAVAKFKNENAGLEDFINRTDEQIAVLEKRLMCTTGFATMEEYLSHMSEQCKIVNLMTNNLANARPYWERTIDDDRLLIAKLRVNETQQINQEKQYVPFTITPEDIITTDQTDREASCKATLAFHGGNRNGQQKPVQYTVR